MSALGADDADIARCLLITQADIGAQSLRPGVSHRLSLISLSLRTAAYLAFFGKLGAAGWHCASGVLHSWDISARQKTKQNQLVNQDTVIFMRRICRIFDSE
jgi:hypothetical protein